MLFLFSWCYRHVLVWMQVFASSGESVPTSSLLPVRKYHICIVFRRLMVFPMSVILWAVVTDCELIGSGRKENNANTALLRIFTIFLLCREHMVTASDIPNVLRSLCLPCRVTVMMVNRHHQNLDITEEIVVNCFQYFCWNYIVGVYF